MYWVKHKHAVLSDDWLCAGNMLQELQHETDREALEQERMRRRELERRLAEEMAKHNQMMEQTIKLREKQKIQAR